MAQYDHLPLRRLEGALERRKRSGFPPQVVARDRSVHGAKIKKEIEDIVQRFAAAAVPDSVDPSLMLKVNVSGLIADDEWARVNLRVLAEREDGAIVLFADDTQLQIFRARAVAYEGGPQGDAKNAPYSGFLDSIESVSELSSADRIGPVLRADGIDDVQDFENDEAYVLDVELWRPDGDMVDVFINRAVRKLEDLGGEILSEYRSAGGLLLRAHGPGRAFATLAEMAEVAVIDYPPQPDLSDAGDPEIALEEIGEIVWPPDDAVAIGVIDSGVASGHPLLAGAMLSAFGLDGLGDDDQKGHGTAVAAIAAFGDISAMVDDNRFSARFRIVSAKVVNNTGHFSDDAIVPKIMDEAIRRLHGEFGCRIVNISLGDPKRMVGRRASLWSSALDDLARELDIVIIVSIGNTSDHELSAAFGPNVEHHYPDYLFQEANRVVEPAGAVNVLTVGSIAHVNGLVEGDGIDIRPICEKDQPSPFTRKGPGLDNAIKPDFVDYGGTAIFNGLAQALQDGARRSSTGVLSLHHQYVDRLFTSMSGTSFASPLLAHKAAMLIERFPRASANLVRALLGLSARHPSNGVEALQGRDDGDRFTIFGYGIPDIEEALYSDDDRVVLYREDSLRPDRFAVFEVPIPQEFQTERGRREITVSLAFDPPVRHTRRDYAGMGMNFQLFRGCTEKEVFEACRKFDKDEGDPFCVKKRYCCELTPKITLRSRGTLQCAKFSMSRDISVYGDNYYLVVRCLGGWAAQNIETQRFSVAVMLRHEAEIQLYNRLRARVEVRV